MKNTAKLGLITVLTLPLFMLPSLVSAQNISDISKFLQAAKSDANALITGYTTPLVKGASYGMTGGWYTTAKTHKTLGVDVGVSITGAIVPSADNYFHPQLSSNTTFVNNTTGSTTQAPTFMGPKDQTTYTSTFQDGQGGSHSVSFSGPEGLNVKHYVPLAAIPVPMIQVGIGLIKNTDLKVRFFPRTTRNGSTISMFGLGLMHDLKQYIPGHDVLPFDLSVLAAFNSVKGTTSLVNTDASKPTSPDGTFHYKLNSWVAQAIISKKLAILTAYLGVGYGSVNTNADITGSFTVSSGGQDFPPIKDPFSTTFKNKTAKLTAGLRIKLGPIYFVSDYSVQKYNALTIGFGASIR